MKKTLLIIFFSIFALKSFSQKLNDTDMHGSWKVIKIISSPNDSQFKLLSNSFKNATFSFHKTGKFNIASTQSSPMFRMYIEKSNNANWILKSNKQLIKIGTSHNNFSIMSIGIKKQNNQILFCLDDTKLVLEMKKQ